jgi:hypothetical protein
MADAVRVIVEMYTCASDKPQEIRVLGVGDEFEDLSDQWSWFKIAGFTVEGITAGESTTSIQKRQETP